MDDSILFDEKSQSIIITTKDKVIQMPSESLTYFINQKPVNLEIPPIKRKGKEYYISLETILPYYPIRSTILVGSHAILIQKDGEKRSRGIVLGKEVNEEKLRLRVNSNLQSPYTAQTAKNEPIFIEGEKGDYDFVRKEDGSAGYLNKNSAKLEGDLEKVTVKQNIANANLPVINGPIQLTWEAVIKKSKHYHNS